MKLSTKLKGILAVLALLLLLTPASAQVVPQLNLYINWTPKEQLTSFDEDGDNFEGVNGTPDGLDPHPDPGGDDIETSEYRYVTAQIYVDGNVQFWTLDLTCRIGTGAELELVDVTYPSGTWGSGSEFLANPGLSGLQTRYNQLPAAGGGTFALTITRVGSNTTPVGINGVDYSLPIANVRFRVKDRTTDAPVNTTCTTIRTLDRNGRQALVGRIGTFTQLYVRIGYTLKGTALRQGATNNLNIRVTCTHLESGDDYEAYTLSNGTFTFGGATNTSQIANHLRHFGLYECIYQSELNGLTLDTQFLRAKSFINLTTPRYQLMPVTLRPGDFERSTSPDTIHILHDLNIITGGTMGRSAGGIFTNGDANGDNIVNQNDLALVAGNVGLSDPTSAILSEHALYGLGTDYNTAFPFPNSRIQMGTPESGAITRRNPTSTTRDFWGTLSPDGSEYAYVSVNPAGLHSLMIGNMTTGAGMATRLPANFRYPHALAPSWSPDGSLIAWICAVNNVDAGLPYNEGHLCYRNRGDTLGNTVTILLNTNGTDINTEIFPPAWFSYPYQDGVGFALIYAEGNTLKYYDLTSNTSGTIPNLPASQADMPVVINHWSGDSFLFYRFKNGATYELRVARLHFVSGDPGNTYMVDSNGLTFATAPTSFGAAGSSGGTPNAVHMLVDNTSNVRYYDVSPMLDIMLYTDEEAHSLTNVYFEASPDPTDPPDLANDYWSGAVVHFVDGNIGSPAVATALGGGLPWSEDDVNAENTPTMYHAQRVTFDWVP